MRARFWGGSGVLLAACGLAQVAGNAPPVDRTAVFTVTSALVQIDAVVMDRQGHPVTNLTARDFEIFEDREPQPVLRASYVPVAGIASASSKSPSTAPGRFAPPPAAPLRADQVSRTMVLVIDDLGLSFESMAFVRRAVLKFIDEQMGPNDLVALFLTGGGAGVFQQFSSDKAYLRSQVEQLHWNPNGRGQVNVFPSLGASPVARITHGGWNGTQGRNPETVSEDFDQVRYDSFTVGTLGGVNFVARALRDLPGRKSILLFSDGLRLNVIDKRSESATAMVDSVRKLIDEANRASAVIYAIDARGVQTGALTASDRPDINERSPGAVRAELEEQRSRRAEYIDITQAGLQYISEKTGGMMLAGNDMAWSIGKVLEDQSGYYLLAYRPPPGTFDETGGLWRYHKISVRLQHAPRGWTIRSRTGFLGATDEATRPKFSSPRQELLASMFTPFHPQGVHLRLTPFYRPAALRILLNMNARDLTFRDSENGKRSADIELVLLVMGANSQPVATVDRQFQIEVSPDKMRQVEQEGALYTVEMQVEKPGAYEIRAAVRDIPTGHFGSAASYLQVPDLKRTRLALTTILLDEGAPDGAREPFLGITPALRQFRRGRQMEYFSSIESRHKFTAVDAMVRVFHDGKQVMETPVDAKRPSGDAPLVVSGTLQLGERMPPGAYFLQVIAWMRGSVREKDAAAQWTDFEVLP